MVVRTSGGVGAARRGALTGGFVGECDDVAIEGLLNSGKIVAVAIERDNLGARHCCYFQ